MADACAYVEQGEGADMLAVARVFEWRISEVVASLTSLVKDMDVEDAKMAVRASALFMAMYVRVQVHCSWLCTCECKCIVHGYDGKNVCKHAVQCEASQPWVSARGPLF
jgi:hypothetical protein